MKAAVTNDAKSQHLDPVHGVSNLPATLTPELAVMDDDSETYILLLLSDSNLPTGSFVASSGLESYIKHGFASAPESTTITFIQDSLAAYAYSALPFVSDAHRIVTRLSEIDSGCSTGAEDIQEGLGKSLMDLTALDELYDTMTLNHVARRASKSQGVALLTLYSKGFSRPSSFPAISGTDASDQSSRMGDLLDRFKLMARKEEVHAHLPICWGALTAALGLSLGSRSTTLSATLDLNEHYSARAVSAPISTRTQSSFGLSPSKRHWSLSCPANPDACRSAVSGE